MATYEIADHHDQRALSEFLQKDGQLLLPLVQLIEDSALAVDDLITVTGRAAVEAVLQLSAQQVAGPKHPGQAAGDIRWHGHQDGVVPLAERKLRVREPRLGRKGGGEEPIPAYTALRAHSPLAERVLAILLRGVSTGAYREVVPQMAERRHQSLQHQPRDDRGQCPNLADAGRTPLRGARHPHRVHRWHAI